MKPRRLIAVGFSAIAATLIAEVLARFLWQNPYSKESISQVVELRVHHKNMDRIIFRQRIATRPPSVRFRTDGRSYILPSKRFEPPDVTVAFLGGSTTECLAVQEQLRFPAQFGYILEGRGLKTNVLNVAHWGNTAYDSVNVLINHLAFDAPDIAVLMHAANDVGVLSVFGSYQDRASRELSGSDVAQWMGQQLSRTSALAGLARQQWTRQGSIVEIHPPDRSFGGAARKQPLALESFETAISLFLGACRSLSIIPVMVTEPVASFRNDMTPNWVNREIQAKFNASLRTVASKHNCELLDMDQYIKSHVERWDVPGEIFYDGLHLSDQGSSLFAHAMADQLEPLVSRVKKGGR